MPKPEQAPQISAGAHGRAEHSYYEGPFLVFTAAHHRERGYCCGNGCRHCPYDENGELVPGKGE